MEAAQQVLDNCKFTKGGYFLPTCDQVRKFHGDPILKTDAGQAALVDFLSHPDRRIRGLAARALNARAKKFRTDPALASKVIEAVNKESDSSITLQMAAAAAQINGNKTGTLDKLTAIATTHAEPRVRARMFPGLLMNNDGVTEPFIMDRAKEDDSPDVRIAAAGAFWGRRSKANPCAFWLERTNDPAPKVAAKCAFFIAAKKGEPCADQLIPLLERIETRANEGKIDDANYASTLKAIGGQRAEKIARKIVDNTKNSGTARAEALKLLNDKALAKKHTKDESVHVRHAAESLVTGKPSPKPKPR